MSRPDPDTLAAALTRMTGASCDVRDLRRLSGGASRETWSFSTSDGKQLILRRDPGAYAGQSDRSTEYEVLRAAHEAGVAVPEVVGLLEPADGLGSGFVMTHVDGETIPRRILRDDEYASARPGLAAQLGAQAALIHAIDPAGLPDLAALGAREQIDQYRGLLDLFGVPHPAFELGLRWLDDHLPEPPPHPRLVHGDLRNGNLVVGPEGLVSVLDWELLHLGDPVEDLGWACVRSWRFGGPGRVGGFGTVEALLDAYDAAGGGVVEPEHLRYWEAFGTLKWGLICEAQAFTHLNGIVRSVELATLGRRVCEMEWDLMELIA